MCGGLRIGTLPDITMQYGNEGRTDCLSAQNMSNKDGGQKSANHTLSRDNSQHSDGDSYRSILAATTDNQITPSTQQVNASAENTSIGKQPMDYASKSISSVYASVGNMDIMQQTAALHLHERKITVSHTDTEISAPAETNVAMQGHKFNAGEIHNANLTPTSGNSISVTEIRLPMRQSIATNDTALYRVYSQNSGENGALFTGEDGLMSPKQNHTSISVNDEILASPCFSYLNTVQSPLSYIGTGNGSLIILSTAVPKPIRLNGKVALTVRSERKLVKKRNPSSSQLAFKTARMLTEFIG